MSRHQKGKNQEGKTNLDLLEQEIVSGVASAGPYASLHLIPDNHANIPPLSGPIGLCNGVIIVGLKQQFSKTTVIRNIMFSPLKS